MVKMHQNSVKEKTTRVARHRDTQNKRSRRLHRSYQDKVQKKTCGDRLQIQRTDYCTFGCISTQSGAREVSYLEIHGPAAVWRSVLKDLPQRVRERHVRRRGSVLTIDLEAWALAKEKKASVDAAVTGISMHPPSGRPKAARVYLRNRLLRRDRERRAHDRVRERQYVTSLLETLVSPSSGGTESWKGVTTSVLQGW